ncbi:hypothetical protein BOTBODRAFT_477103 [Botryobasidium botryosum FD-172 SS1]|uniref:Uncharacterized protein n=1 Tax=Botryobasidium botryosum (strain FD-172 SS1) TaxID=930990 RepID=A0A067MSZ5_BOTB1|nr:hypothetical protein BOTBODRAFT_477103 [Botryobasidium botryosum FD-172 SS1]
MFWAHFDSDWRRGYSIPRPKLKHGRRPSGAAQMIFSCALAALVRLAWSCCLRMRALHLVHT